MTNIIKKSSLALLACTMTLGLAACGSSDSSSTQTASSAASSAPASATASAAPATQASSAPATEASSAPASSAAPVTDGQQVKGKGYTITVPKGWKKAELPQVDVAYAAPSATDGFTPNLNVMVVDAKGVTDVSTALPDIKKSLEQMKATEVTSQGEGTMDGEKALQVSSVMTSGGQKYRALQSVAIHEGKAYTLTWSVPESVSVDEAKVQAQQVTDSWKWAS